MSRSNAEVVVWDTLEQRPEDLRIGDISLRELVDIMNDIAKSS